MGLFLKRESTDGRQSSGSTNRRRFWKRKTPGKKSFIWQRVFYSIFRNVQRRMKMKNSIEAVMAGYIRG